MAAIGLTAVGCGSDNTQNLSSDLSVTSDDNGGESEKTEDISVKEYKQESGVGSTTYYFVLTNNTDSDLTLDTEVRALDENGSELESSEMYVSIIGGGETTIASVYFDTEGIDRVEYTLEPEESEGYYESAISDITYATTQKDDSVVVDVTNNGNKDIEFGYVYGIFSDENGNTLYIDWNSMYDSDYELKAGDTVSTELSYYGDADSYDNVELYFQAYRARLE